MRIARAKSACDQAFFAIALHSAGNAADAYCPNDCRRRVMFMSDGVVHTLPSVNAHQREEVDAAVTMGTMAASKRGETEGDFAGRLAAAIAAEEKSPTRTGREAGLQEGYIFKLLGVAQAKQVLSPGPDVIRLLADYLNISYEWLAIGRGPMRYRGWAATPFEEARVFAKRHGLRDEAIRAAEERFGSAQDMTAVDWVIAFDSEARRLDRVASPRPEVEKRRAKSRRRGAA